MTGKKKFSLPIVFIGLLIVFFILAGFIIAFETTLGETLVTALVLSITFSILTWKYPQQTIENKERNVLLFLGFFAYAILQTLHGGVVLESSWLKSIISLAGAYIIPGGIWGIVVSYSTKKLAGV